jgi:hypothetical protein
MPATPACVGRPLASLSGTRTFCATKAHAPMRRFCLLLSALLAMIVAPTRAWSQAKASASDSATARSAGFFDQVDPMRFTLTADIRLLLSDTADEAPSRNASVSFRDATGKNVQYPGDGEDARPVAPHALRVPAAQHLVPDGAVHRYPVRRAPQGPPDELLQGPPGLRAVRPPGIAALPHLPAPDAVRPHAARGARDVCRRADGTDAHDALCVLHRRSRRRRDANECRTAEGQGGHGIRPRSVASHVDGGVRVHDRQHRLPRHRAA